jgi:hypothetical protein
LVAFASFGNEQQQQDAQREQKESTAKVHWQQPRETQF